MKGELLSMIRVPEIVPAGQAGIAAVEHFTITRKEADRENMMQSFRPGTGLDAVEAGRFARLRIGGQVMMSDTPMERLTNWEVVDEARGDVLVAGLGLGLILYPMIAKEGVRSITVVEMFADVIALVWPHVKAFHGRVWPSERRSAQTGKVTAWPPHISVVHADIFKWMPAGRGKTAAKYDVIYFDIWPTRAVDNLPQIAKLHQRFKGRKRPGGWMGSWCEDVLRGEREEQRRAGW
jgi:spermidine synthase